MTDKDNYFVDGEGNKTPMPELDYSNKKSPTTKLEVTKLVEERPLTCISCEAMKQTCKEQVAELKAEKHALELLCEGKELSKDELRQKIKELEAKIKLLENQRIILSNDNIVKELHLKKNNKTITGNNRAIREFVKTSQLQKIKELEADFINVSKKLADSQVKIERLEAKLKGFHKTSIDQN